MLAGTCGWLLRSGGNPGIRELGLVAGAYNTPDATFRSSSLKHVDYKKAIVPS